MPGRPYSSSKCRQGAHDHEIARQPTSLVSERVEDGFGGRAAALGGKQSVTMFGTSTALAPSSPLIAAPSRVPRRDPLRQAFVAVVSVVAMLLLAAYFAIPTRYALALSSVQTTTISKRIEVVYGKVQRSDGVPLSGFRATVLQPQGKRLVEIKHTTTDAKGVYRMELRVPAGKYVVRLSGRYHGKSVAASKTVSLALHHAYRVSASLSRKALLTFLPVSSY
jgi:hypothetical protein